ncbi:LOW QUALITY PROTEIN: hypothetical protein V2J09_000611 [Rumex salicifolius]
MADCKPCRTPIETGQKISSTVGHPLLIPPNSGLFSEYLTFTRPDICYPVQQTELDLWSSNRQPTLSRSSCEAEYRAVENIQFMPSRTSNFNCGGHLYPNLFRDIKTIDFHCETFEKAKHTCVSFRISNTRSQFPFQLVHSDIWGPSFIANRISLTYITVDVNFLEETPFFPKNPKPEPRVVPTIVQTQDSNLNTVLEVTTASTSDLDQPIAKRKGASSYLNKSTSLFCSMKLEKVDVSLQLLQWIQIANSDQVDKGMYQRLCGRLIYLSHTRPDIAFLVSVISQFMHDPREPHLQAALRILHHLKGYPGKGILFRRDGKLSLKAFTIAAYGGSIANRHSTTWYCIYLTGNLIVWRSKKQGIVARSSVESEYRAAAHRICELLWLRIILSDLKIKWDNPMKLHCDNKSAINIAHDHIQHDRTKYIEVDRHFIKRKIKAG